MSGKKENERRIRFSDFIDTPAMMTALLRAEITSLEMDLKEAKKKKKKDKSDLQDMDDTIATIDNLKASHNYFCDPGEVYLRVEPLAVFELVDGKKHIHYRLTDRRFAVDRS